MGGETEVSVGSKTRYVIRHEFVITHTCYVGTIKESYLYSEKSAVSRIDTLTGETLPMEMSWNCMIPPELLERDKPAFQIWVTQMREKSRAAFTKDTNEHPQGSHSYGMGLTRVDNKVIETQVHDTKSNFRTCVPQYAMEDRKTLEDDVDTKSPAYLKPEDPPTPTEMSKDTISKASGKKGALPLSQIQACEKTQRPSFIKKPRSHYLWNLMIARHREKQILELLEELELCLSCGRSIPRIYSEWYDGLDTSQQTGDYKEMYKIAQLIPKLYILLSMKQDKSVVPQLIELLDSMNKHMGGYCTQSCSDIYLQRTRPNRARAICM